MKTLYCYKALIIILLALSIPLMGFAQCSVSSTVFSENFNSPSGTITDCGSGGHSTTTLPAGQTKGAYAAACSGSIDLSDNAEDCLSGGADTWKTSSTGGGTGSGGGVNNYALFVDGCGTVANGSVWCTSITVSAGQKYGFSADLGSQWMEEKQNDPDVYFTINGVQAGATTMIEQYTSTGPTSYETTCFMYTIPAGTSGAVDFCINLKQRTGGTSGTPGSGSYGADGQGNDILIDNIKIELITGSGCTSGAACTFIPTPVELIMFEAKELSGSSAFLHWSTASEKNSSYFSIEKSEDGINFTEIGIVNAQGTSNNIVNYEFDDSHFNRSSYYRLKIIDKNGSFKYSSLTFLKNDINVRIISSLDTKEELQIKAIVAEDAQWNLAVYSLLGQEYLNEKVSLKKGENTILKQVSGGEQSAKIVRITSAGGAVILSEVIVW